MKGLLTALFVFCLGNLAVWAKSEFYKEIIERLTRDSPPSVSKAVELANSYLQFLDVIEEYIQLMSHGSDSSLLRKSNEKNDENVLSRRKKSLVQSMDLFLLGFPTKAIEAVGEKWFQGMDQENHLFAAVRNRGTRSLVEFPGSLSARSHLNVVKISPRVINAIRSRAKSLLRKDGRWGLQNSTASLDKSDDDGLYYLNSWDMEEILQSLQDHLFDSSTRFAGAVGDVPIEEKTPRRTASNSALFFLNLDIRGNDGRPVKYRYIDGFSNYDLELMSKNQELLQLSQQIIQNRKARLRREVNRVVAPASDIFDDVRNATVREAGGNTRPSGEHADSAGRSRHWALILESQTIQSQEEHGEDLFYRAAQILKPDENKKEKARSVLGHYQLTLAKSIVDASQGKEHNGHCSHSTWVGQSRVMWKDITAMEYPLESQGTTKLTSPSPRSLDEEQWSQISATVDRPGFPGFQKSYALLSVGHLLNHVKNLQHISGCLDRDKRDRFVLPLLPTRNDVIDQARSVAESATIKPWGSNCLLRSLQAALLQSTLDYSKEISRNLGLLRNVSRGSKVDDLENYAFEEVESLLEKLIWEATDIADVFSGLETISRRHLSEESSSYLSFMANFAHQAAKKLLSPPMNLGLNSREYSSAMDSIETVKLDSSSIQYEEQLLLKMATGYNGERLSDFVRASGSQWRDSTVAYQPIHGKRIEQLGRASAAMYGRGYQDAMKEILLWISSAPNVGFPDVVEVPVYVVKAQSSYQPVSLTLFEAGFDITSFMDGLEQIVLPSQRLSTTYYSLDSSNEDHLASAIHECMRISNRALEEVSNGRTNLVSLGRRYLDSECIYSFLIENSDVFRAKSAESTKGHSETARKTSFSILTDQLTRARQRLSYITLPVFILSVDSTEPIYLDEFHQAVSVSSGGVLVVQNRQAHIPMGRFCNGQMAYWNGRNPVAAALQALLGAAGGSSPWTRDGCSSTVGSLRDIDSPSSAEFIMWKQTIKNDNYGQIASCSKGKSEVADLDSIAVGPSPSFDLSAFSVPRFSEFEIDNLHRMRMLFLVALSQEMDSLLRRSFGPGFRNLGNADAIKSLEASKQALKIAVDLTMRCVEERDWTAGATNANALLRILESLSKFADVVVSQVETNSFVENVGPNIDNERESSKGAIDGMENQAFQLAWRLVLFGIFPLILLWVSFKLAKAVRNLLKKQASKTLSGRSKYNLAH